MGRTSYTDLLFAQPTMLSGFARTLDIGGALDQYNESDTESEADYLALASDWYAVSDDLLRAIEATKAQLRRDKPGRTDGR